ncbi:MAG: ABC transporter substrate-binding protein [Verrucomicrobia bacterium]|nr:MAG: ABC transporter substrate-binding protein [Verrucomicrobiota bacterium]
MKSPAPAHRRHFIALVAAGLVLAGCKPSDDAGKPGAASTGAIVVGEFASLHGSEAAFGQSSHKGTELAFDVIRSNGGLLGREVRLITEDNQSKAGESATIAKKFVSRDHVVAVLGEVASGRSLEAAPICQAAGIPMISPSSTNPKVTEVGDHVFRVCFTDPFQGKLLADFAWKSLKVRRVAILADTASAYSVGLADFFRQPFVAAGGTVVTEVKYASRDKDFKAQLTAIKAAAPDGLCVPGYYTEVGLIVKQARELGLTVPIFGGDGWEAPQLIEIAGSEALKNTFYSTHFSPAQDNPAVKAFVAAFKSKFNEVPDAMAALGYDSAMALAEAIKKAGSTDPAKVTAALAATDFVGVTGRTKLDAQRNATKPAVIITVENGGFKFLQTVEP